VQEAVQARKWDTAYAIQTLWDEQENDDEGNKITKQFEDIIMGKATDAEREKWHSAMRSRKKEGNLYRTAESFFVDYEPAERTFDRAQRGSGSIIVKMLDLDMEDPAKSRLAEDGSHVNFSENSVEELPCCEICYEKTQDTVFLPCDCRYCHECAREFILKSFNPSARFPPKCCGYVVTPGSMPPGILSSEIIQRYEEKKAEFNYSDPTYCSDPRCSALIRSEHIVNFKGSCSVCKMDTCAKCKHKFHGEEACPDDTNLALAKEWATAHKCQKCNGCGQMVERTEGCDDMM